jgi:hypothetical protein
MTDQRTPDLPAIGTPSGADLLTIVDVSDTADDASGSSKKIRYDEIIDSGFGFLGNQVYVSGVNGSDSNSGLTPSAAKATLPAALTTVEAMGGGGNFRGALLLDSGPHQVSSQFVIPASVALLGNHQHANFGFESLYDNGSWIEWVGSNPASPGLTAGSVLKTSAYDRGGVIKNVSVKLAGSMPNLRGIDMVDWQNMSRMEGVLVKGDHFDIGFCAYNKTNIGAPGFFKMDRCWCAGGARRPFLISGGVEQILMSQCGVDDGNGATTSRAEAAWTIGDSGVSDDTFPGGSSLSLLMESCKNEMGSTTADYPFIEVQSAYDLTLIATACYEQSNFAAGGGLTTAAISYLAAPSEPDDILPVFVYGMSSQSRALLLDAPNASPPVSIAPGTSPSGGARTRWSYDASNLA